MTQDSVGAVEKATEEVFDHVEEKTSPSSEDVGYKEYLESLDIDFSRKEERWVRWKLDVGFDMLIRHAPIR